MDPFHRWSAGYDWFRPIATLYGGEGDCNFAGVTFTPRLSAWTPLACPRWVFFCCGQLFLSHAAIVEDGVFCMYAWVLVYAVVTAHL